MRLKPGILSICLVLGFAVLLNAYFGPLEKGLRHWADNQAYEAISEFRAFAKTDQLAEFNLFTAQGSLLLDSLKYLQQAEPVRLTNSTARSLPASITDSSPLIKKNSRSDAVQSAIEVIKDSLRVLIPALEELSKVGRLAEYALYQSARYHLALGDRDAALVNIQAAYRKNPELQRISHMMFELLIIAGDFRELKNQALHQIAVRPDNPAAWWALGKSEKNNGYPHRALDAWTKGIEVYPLRVMLEDGIILANDVGRFDLVLAWMKDLRFRYSHVYNQSRIAGFCESIKAPWLVAQLGEFNEKQRYEDSFPQFFPENREWHYKVSFGLIPLGKLIVGVKSAEEWLPSPDASPRKAYRVYYKVDSNPIYKWLIDLNDYYEALIPEHCLSSLQFITHSRIGKHRFDKTYDLDFDAGSMRARGYYKQGLIFSDDIPIAQQLFDGISLLYAARRQVLENNYNPVLTIIDEEAHRTIIGNNGPGKMKVMKKSIPVVKIHGTADYKGIAGLTGEFWGVFTADDEALPVSARFQISVGSIRIQLDEIR
jgi:tetratricopeptide (TPR) repeat protein